jgi:hypothetical protein
MVPPPLRAVWSLDIGCAFVRGWNVVGGGLRKADVMVERKGALDLDGLAPRGPSESLLHAFPPRRCVIARILRSSDCNTEAPLVARLERANRVQRIQGRGCGEAMRRRVRRPSPPIANQDGDGGTMHGAKRLIPDPADTVTWGKTNRIGSTSIERAEFTV